MAASEEFHYVHAPAGVEAARQYTYEIGSYHYNWHRDSEILLVVDGAIEVCVSGDTRVIEVGDIALINSNEGHATLSVADRSAACLLHISPRYLERFCPEGVVFSCVSETDNREREPFARLRGLLARMMVTSAQVGAAEAAAWERDLADVTSILLGHFRARPEDGMRLGEGPEDDMVRAVTTYIDAHFSERLSLADLARQAGYSPAYLSDAFSRKLGITTSDYMTRVRLAHAVGLLGRTDERIASIAYASGFADVKSFGVAFRQTFSKTPSEYRHQLRAAGESLAEVDRAFHTRYVPRTDPVIAPRLAAWAGSLGGVVDSQTRDNALVAAEIRGLAGHVDAVAQRMSELAGRIDGLR
ncbi:MAG: AraC family transcriptional regulator [Actinomycetaceae bacterium]|nr:AraC family transcriptional regulator [Actinomycetaceae bacterium]MDU0969939.1 AraC family transcriptional regulator [Actinomycetaceae bacterium]